MRSRSSCYQSGVGQVDRPRSTVGIALISVGLLQTPRGTSVPSGNRLNPVRNTLEESSILWA